MLKSMTAYGRAMLAAKEGHFVAEVQSLNRKFQEINIQLPRELSCLETDVRKWVSSKILRGKISLRITAVYEDKMPISVKPNLPLAKQLKAAWEEIAKSVGIGGSQGVNLQMLAGESGILTYNESFDQEEYKKILKTVVDEALEALICMKIREGNAVEEDFLSRITTIRQLLARVRDLSKDSVNRYKEKLSKRLEAVVPGILENEERVLREVCVYADRVDIAEEILRLDSHLGHFLEILNDQRYEKGKTLEFILQEMLREVNTIGSKSDDFEIAKAVVAMKSETEKIREQVQNVE